MLGRLACLVLSKIVGLGSSERNWKELKRVKTPTRNALGSDKLAKLTTLVGHHCAAKSERRRARLARAGKLWTEDDFETLNLKKFGIDTSALSGKTKPKRVFRAWRETWESPENEKGRKINPIHAQRLLAKYSGLKWYDMDEAGAPITVFDGEICFYQDGKDAGYHIFGVYEGFDMNLGIDDNDEKLHNVFDRSIDFYEDIVTYYKQQPDPDVTVLEFDMDNDSESDREETVEDRNKKRVAELETDQALEEARVGGT